jgi:hypothetical protein
MHIKSTVSNSIATISPKKPYILAGFEPGSSEADPVAISTAPRRCRQGNEAEFVLRKILT